MLDFVELDYKLLPSPPGYTLWRFDAGRASRPEPIIGWAIAYAETSNANPGLASVVKDVGAWTWLQHPITASGVVDEDLPNGDRFVVQYPDGRVHLSGHGWFASLDSLCSAFTRKPKLAEAL
jgi:hypothetical protein